MAPLTKLAICGVLGVLILGAAVASALHPPTRPTLTIAVPANEAMAASHSDLARCRTLTMPDSGCDAAWEARRRYFFGERQSR